MDEAVVPRYGMRALMKSDPMERIRHFPLPRGKAAFWFLGQSGFIFRGGRTTLAIDPYLSDSVGRLDARFSRRYPPPILPQELRVDILVITHDHLDHLDPKTLRAYRHKRTTTFVGPRLVCRRLVAMGVPRASILRVDSGEEVRLGDVLLRGTYAVPTDPAVMDTTGYLFTFPGGRTAWHTSDTAFSELLCKAAPRCEILLPVINGKWGNLGAEQAAEVVRRVQPRFAIPHHHDLMELNAEDPRTFAVFVGKRRKGPRVHVPALLDPFVW